MESQGRQAAPPAGPGSAVSRLWRQFDAQRSLQRARNDQLGAGVLLACCMAARGRVGELPTPEAEAHSFATVALCISVLLTAGELTARGHHLVRR